MEAPITARLLPPFHQRLRYMRNTAYLVVLFLFGAVCPCPAAVHKQPLAVRHCHRADGGYLLAAPSRISGCMRTTTGRSCGAIFTDNHSAAVRCLSAGISFTFVNTGDCPRRNTQHVPTGIFSMRSSGISERSLTERAVAMSLPPR